MVVLGSGLAGLVAGFELAERGLHVTVLEAAAMAGGRTSSWVDARGRELDTGAHVVADHYVNLRDVLARVGVAHRLVWSRAQQFLRPGAPPVVWQADRVPPPFHLVRTALRFRASSSLWVRFARLAADAATHSEATMVRLDRLSFAQWQRSYIGEALQEVADAAAEAACFLPAEEASAQVVLSWIRAMARTAQASHVASWDAPFQQALIGPLVAAIEARGGRLRLRTAAVRLEHSGRRVAAVITRPTSCQGPMHRADGRPPLAGVEERLPCDHLVSALPCQAFQAVVDPGLARTAGVEGAMRLEVVPAMGLTVWFDRPIVPSPTSPPLCAGVAMRGFMDLASVRRRQAHAPAVIQFVLNGARGRAHQSDDEIAADVVRDFQAVWAPARGARAVDHALERVGAAMMAARPGTYALRPQATTGIGNLFLAGDWTRGEVKSSMEGAAASGRAAADALLRASGSPGLRMLSAPEGLLVEAMQRMRRRASESATSG